jgi:hypothetical protein
MLRGIKRGMRAVLIAMKYPKCRRGGVLLPRPKSSVSDDGGSNRETGRAQGAVPAGRVIWTRL